MKCTKCGAEVPQDGKFCTSCGAEVVVDQRVVADFWPRVGASFLDGLLLIPVSILLAAFGIGARQSPGYFSMQLAGVVVSLVIFGSYRFLLEASPWQGTLGKLISRLQVTDLNGARLTVAQSLKREGCRQLIELAGTVSVFATNDGVRALLLVVSLIVGIVDLAWMARSPLKQTLHDQMAGTLVYRKLPDQQSAADLTSQPKWY